MRGKQILIYIMCADVRITPACAGKTKNLYVFIMDNQDHPRVCGENLKPFTHSSATVGSPPRVRGKHGKPTLATRFGGITPACAGKTVFRL